jgi:hypothetical protein
VRRLAHHFGAWVVVFVHAVAEAHQAEGVILVLGLLDEFRDPLCRANLVQHVEAGLIGAAMAGAPQAGHAGSDSGERVSARRTGEAHGRGRRVLLVICVKDEEAVHGFRDGRVHFVVFCRNREAHVQEVFGVGILVPRIDEFLAEIVFQDAGTKGRHLGQETDGVEPALFRVFAVHGARVERGEAAHSGGQHGHRVAVATETFKEPVHLGVQQGVLFDGVVEHFQFRCCRQLTVQDQVADFREGGLFGELPDGVAAVQKNAFIPIDESDLAFTAGCRCETGVEREMVRLSINAADIDYVRTVCSGKYREFVGISGHIQFSSAVRFRFVFHQPYLQNPSCFSGARRTIRRQLILNSSKRFFAAEPLEYRRNIRCRKAACECSA